MQLRGATVALLCALLVPLGALASEGPTSVGKVVQLLQDMKKTVEKEGDADAEAYDKYSCWCKTSKKEKTEAVEVAEARIADAEAELEKLAGLIAEMKTEIEELTKSIAEDEESLEAAAALRAKENEEYKAAAADMTETVTLLSQAIEVLSKVQLVQKSHQSRDPALLQLFDNLKTKLTAVHPSHRNFRSVMQQDFFDMLNALSSVPQNQLRGAETSSLVQQPVISDEEKGMMEKPNNLTGLAANAKSYNSRSGSILGILAEMKDEFNRDLAEATKAEEAAAKQFQKLKKAKLAEIAAATAQKKQNEKTLADSEAQTAATKRDLEKTKAALAKDQETLVNLEKMCKDEDEAFSKRTKNRALELQAISEAIKILTEDDARTLFDKTITKELSFLQLSNAARSKASKAKAGLIAKQKAVAVGRSMRKILHVAAKNQDWSLASMAIHMSLDSFTKVKEAMDTMIAELKKQQAEESEKWEFCKSEIDSTEDQIKVKNIEKEDLEEEKHGLENTIAKLEADIEQLNKEVAEMAISLKAVGEDRKAENLVFQQSITEQRQTANILRKALARLQVFYTPNSTALAQFSQEPGAALATPPPKPSTTAYRKSEGAGGVLQLMIQIIGDVEAAESELQIDEQHAQEDYATFAADATAAIEAKRASIAEKTKAKEQNSADLSETEESLLSNGEEITSLEGTLKGLHLDCDFLLKYYKVRQTARSEEMGAIAEAKAILSGAGIDEAEEAGEKAEA